MIPLDTILPELQRAVADRRESPTLASMGPADLRHLIYKLVERQRAVSLNATEHFRELVQSAAQHHSDLVEAREHSVTVRAEMLKELLGVLTPALPSLLGPVVVETIHATGERDQQLCHPHFRGLELINGMKTLTPSEGIRSRSGVSWWILGLPGEDPADRVDVRYARLRHRGDIVRGGGITSAEIELVTSEGAAAQIRDHQFGEILKRIHERLVNVAGPRVVKTTGSLWEVADALSSALEAMKTRSAPEAREA
ncbi:MAG: hypothetical protein K0U16_07350 [Gammaproteobacteria bacterium]|nr:hypothetical protein [Gammaproteobacteria bacterium]